MALTDLPLEDLDVPARPAARGGGRGWAWAAFGVGALVLMVAPIQGIFGVVGLGMAAMFVLASRLHPMLGVAPAARVRRGTAGPV